MAEHLRKCVFLLGLVVVLFGEVYGEKYKICIVDGKEELKRSLRYCPKLDNPDSLVECVVALDRLDCLRRIQKGKAHLGIFTPEDLVAAVNSEIEILITNELRYFKDRQFEYEVVAVISNNADIRSKHHLSGKKYCHPGYGYEADWTRILSNYFEASVVSPQCETNLTITENRIKASSSFFGAACKAGPWVGDAVLDRQLKHKYPNLCKLCGDPYRCSMQDKYWGRRGSLLCLTDGAGDISWARWEDVQQHFGLVPGGAEAGPDDYSLLCPDNTVMPLNSSNPCIWVVKPWSVVATARTKAQQIQAIVSSLDHSEPSSWKSNLLSLLEPTYLNVETLDPIISIESYFHQAKGFLNANSFSACHPPRTIRICTTSNVETAKCSWLRESAAVYGIEPDMDCLKADNKTHCMMAVNEGAADLVMVEPDLVQSAKRDFNLETLFYETTGDGNKYVTVPVVRKDSKFESLEELRGAKACFPVYDGVAWNSVVSTLQKKHIIGGCSVNEEMSKFFGPSCVPQMPKNDSDSLRTLCETGFQGDLGALQCLSSGVGDVAFISRNSIGKFLSSNNFDYPGPHEDESKYKIICQKGNLPCHLSWAPLGQAMVRASSSEMWKKDTLNVFLQLDGLFGKNFKDLTNSFTLFGRYDGVSDVLFHDATEKLRDVPTVKNTDKMDLPYDSVLSREIVCYSSSTRIVSLVSMLLVTVFSRLF